MKSRSEVKNEAKKIMKGKTIKIFLIILLFMFLSSLLGTTIENIAKLINPNNYQITEIFGTTYESQKFGIYTFAVDLISIAIQALFTFGMYYYLLNLIRDKKVNGNEIIQSIKKNWENVIVVSILAVIFTTLGFICLIIPGIIITLGLSMIMPIIIDNPELQYMEVIKKSWNMMNNHKMEYFIYDLSFIGWILLCVFVIPVVYVAPYITLTYLLFYEELRKNSIN